MVIVIEVIPYSTFKEKIRLVKAYSGQGKIEIFDSYVYIEKIERNKMGGE